MNRTTRLLLALLMLAWLAPVQAAVRATLDRDQAIEGDPVTLTIRQEGGIAGAEPDLTPLQQDFTVQGTSRGSEIRIVNGRRSAATFWSIRLLPKRTGSLRIPPLQVGGERTAPLTLRVQPPPDPASAGPDQPALVELEAELPSGKSYVQQQIPVVVRLLYRGRLRGGSLDDPAPEHAVVERLGDERRYRTIRNGREYSVIERRYAIFPERSGELRIPPVVFRGRMADPAAAGRRRADPFDRFFGQDPMFQDFEELFRGSPFAAPGKRVAARSRALTLQVLPRPAGYSGQSWLPAEAVTLEDSWRDAPPDFRAGEPVSRTITLMAKGLEASQIPPLELPQPEGFRLYADPPETETRTDGTAVYGVSRRTFTYLPKQPGRHTIPEVRLDWWNTATGRQEQTVLPPWQVEVKQGTGAAPADVPPAPAKTSDEASAPAPAASRPAWPWLLGAGGILALVVFVVAWRRRHPAGEGRTTATTAPATSAPPRPRPALAAARRHLRQACDRNDPREAARTLLELAEARWPDDPPRNLGAVARRLDTAAEQIRELERILYAPTARDWQGASLWRAVDKGLGETGETTAAPSEPLPPLYP